MLIYYVPIVVGCLLFYKDYIVYRIVLHVNIIRGIGFYLLHQVLFPVSEMGKCIEGVHCCFQELHC